MAAEIVSGHRGELFVISKNLKDELQKIEDAYHTSSGRAYLSNTRRYTAGAAKVWPLVAPSEIINKEKTIGFSVLRLIESDGQNWIFSYGMGETDISLQGGTNSRWELQERLESRVYYVWDRIGRFNDTDSPVLELIDDCVFIDQHPTFDYDEKIRGHLAEMRLGVRGMMI